MDLGIIRKAGVVHWSCDRAWMCTLKCLHVCETPCTASWVLGQDTKEHEDTGGDFIVLNSDFLSQGESMSVKVSIMQFFSLI